jgi:hypothetical protein
LLASTLGEEKALAVWQEAVQRLGLPVSEALSREQMGRVFDAISTVPGIVGVAARYARLRLDRADPTPSSSARASNAAPEIWKELLALLAPSVGEDKAHDAIVHAAKTLSMSVTELTREQAVQVLDLMANSVGLLGVAARFGKARFLLYPPR